MSNYRDRGRRYIDLPEVLRFNEKWSDADRTYIKEQIDRLEGTSFYVLVSDPKQYVGVMGRRGGIDNLMTINSGFIEFPSRHAPEDALRNEGKATRYYPLSTNQPHDSPTREPDHEGDVCPTCFITLPLTGVCDNCS